MADLHAPVLLEEALDALCTDIDGHYVDATFGRGGHATALLARLGDNGRMLALDRDPQAVAVARELAARDRRVTAVHGRMSDMAAHAAAARLDNIVGVLMDLGVSSPQIDDPDRGFSFRDDGPLDMRMDNSEGQSAAEWLAEAPEAELTRVFRDYGEERFSRRIAREIVQRRTAQPLTRTGELIDAINAAQPRPDPHKHAATRVFQAIRIQINDELGELRAALQAAFALLADGGRLAVISFHSLEDRIVKHTFQGWCRGPELLRRLPIRGRAAVSARSVVRARRAGERETAVNPRARSALLRVIEKLPQPTGQGTY